MSTKKDEIKASLKGELFSYLTGKANQHKMSLQDYISQLAYEATNNEQIIRSIARWFRRGYQLTSSEWFMGHVIAAKYQDLLPVGKATYRRSLKYTDPRHYLRVCEVASALACPPATAATILLFATQLQGFDIADTEDTSIQRIG